MDKRSTVCNGTKRKGTWSKEDEIDAAENEGELGLDLWQHLVLHQHPRNAFNFYTNALYLLIHGLLVTSHTDSLLLGFSLNKYFTEFRSYY